MLPELNIWFRKYNEQGNPVRGHAARCYSIANEWRKRGGMVNYFPREVPIKSISLSDGIYTILTYLTDMSISIKDKPEGVENKTDILVCPNPGAEYLDWNFTGTKLLGPSYFPRRPEYDKYRLYDSDYIAIAPGSNKNEFYSQVDYHSIDYRKVVVDGFTPEMAADLISCAKVVICPASTAAMEAMSMGKPTFIIKTADDQDLLYEWLPHLGAAYYNEALLDFTLSDSEYYLRFAYRSERSIPSDGVVNLVDAILYEWEKRQ